MSASILSPWLLISALCVIAVPGLGPLPCESRAPAGSPLTIAHRGASAYAPEHTLAAYRLAVELGADFVEQDLQVTSDGVLICLHDADLARTTNAAELFPDRATMRDPEGRGTARRGWYTIDFTLAEIKRLDAGSWFNRANEFAARESFTRERVPTLDEAIEAVGNRAGLYIEIKHFEFYRSLGHDPAEMLARMLNARGFETVDQRRRIYIQSFSKASLIRMREIAPHYRRVQLLPMTDPEGREDPRKVTAGLAREVATYAHGVGPSKSLIAGPSDVAEFHRAGLVVHPYTFRGSTTATSRLALEQVERNGRTVRENILDEMRRFIRFGVDGAFTDYPDLWREAVKKGEAGGRRSITTHRVAAVYPSEAEAADQPLQRVLGRGREK